MLMMILDAGSIKCFSLQVGYLQLRGFRKLAYDSTSCWVKIKIKRNLRCGTLGLEKLNRFMSLRSYS